MTVWVDFRAGVCRVQSVVAKGFIVMHLPLTLSILRTVTIFNWLKALT